ncbi:MAG: hypothetical protein DI606_04435 [Sphingobium sp.]|uniref:hypothetical protein n=1 Tax=Sphingobium sp. TaxID=1912891 RepID=UPI000DB7DDBE|nr:hypothetical protein [Sphingobium sp.]PZU13819.1 MAG: hypothetical protein DI606_04435 [Sphingobium sp.]
MRRMLLSLFVLASACSPHRAEIDPAAVSMMTPAVWPKMYAALGPESFARANAKMRAAAEYAAADRACGRVEYVGVSPSASTPQRIEWFVDCTPEYRIRLSEDDLT